MFANLTLPRVSNQTSRLAPESHLLLCAPGPAAETVTSALAWFHARRRYRFDEVHIVVSSAHADMVRGRLLGGSRRQGLLDRTCRRLGLADETPYLSGQTIHVVPKVTREEHGLAPAPIETMAEALWQVVRQLCVERMAEVSVVTSEASGLVGSMLHGMLPLTSSHATRLYFAVSNPKGDDGKVRTSAHVEVPLVLWSGTAPTRAEASFLAMAHRHRTELARLHSPDVLHVRLATQDLLIGAQHVRLPRAQFFWYACFAATSGQRFLPPEIGALLAPDQDGRIGLIPPSSNESHAARRLALLRRLHRTIYRDAEETLPGALWHACGPHPLLPSIVSKINARLKLALGPGARPYLVAAGRHDAGYGLTLDADCVQLHDS